jgi:hypothetical protein
MMSHLMVAVPPDLFIFGVDPPSSRPDRLDGTKNTLLNNFTSSCGQ